MARLRRGGAKASGDAPGYSLFELLVVIALISILAGVLLDRILRYQEYAEKTAMEQTVVTLRSALNLQLADYLVRGRWQDVGKLVKSNPMDWLERKPDNYLGEFTNPRPGEISPGSWYFDLKDHVLVYQVNSERHFVADEAGRKRVRFRVSASYDHPVKENAAPADKNEINGIRLTLVDAYRWF